MSGYSDIVTELGREYNESERFAYMKPKTTRKKHAWEVSDDPTDFLVHVPFLPQIIEAQRTVIGAMRSHRVPLPAPEGQPYADKLERGISHMWREWGMSRFLSEMGWYCVVMGTAIGVLQWDKQNKMPRAVIRSPENFYAVPSVDDERRVQIGMFVTKTMGRILNAQYPELKQSLANDEEYEVIDYYDTEVRLRVIKDVKKPLIEAKNPIKHTTIYVFPGIVLPNSIFGASFLTQSIPLQNEMDRLYSKQAEYLEMAINAPTFIKDPDNVPENFTWNKDTVVTMGPQGAIGKAPITSIDARVFEYRMEDMKRNLDNSMDFASISRGEMPSNIVTGKGVTALSAPSQQRTMLRLQSIDPEIERMTEDALLLWNKGGGGGSRQIYGQKQGSMFTDIFDPKKDIDPNWVETWVYLDAASFIDRQAAQITSLQKLRGMPQAMSLQRFLELDPDCEDVGTEMGRIQTEMQQQIALQQQAAAPPPQADQNLSAEKGGMVEGGGAPSGAGNSAAPPGATAPAPEELGGGEDVTAAVADLFRAIAKVKGEVWLVGDYLQGGISPEEFAEGMIEVYVSLPVDKATILNALRATELAGAVEQQRVVFHDNRQVMVEHWSLNVSPGTSGYDPSPPGEEEPPTDEQNMPPGMSPDEMMMGAPGGMSGAPPGGGGVPPEMAAMMGGGM